jgi:hypothetical protein
MLSLAQQADHIRSKAGGQTVHGKKAHVFKNPENRAFPGAGKAGYDTYRDVVSGGLNIFPLFFAPPFHNALCRALHVCRIPTPKTARRLTQASSRRKRRA